MLLEQAKTILDSSNIPRTNREFWGQVLVQSSDEIVYNFINLFKNDNELLAIATRFLYARLFCKSLEDNVTSEGEIKLILDTLYKKRGKVLLQKNIGNIKPISTEKIISILKKDPYLYKITRILPFIDLISIPQVDN